MSRYRMADGTILDTNKATQSWEEDTYWDGRNHISKPTGSQWEHQRLYRSAKGRYYIESWSAYQGTTETVEFVEHPEAASWLLLNGHDLPEELAQYEASVVE